MARQATEHQRRDGDGSREREEQRGEREGERAGSGAHAGLQDQREHEEAEERSAPTSKVILRTIVKQGEEELERSPGAIFWSGLACGISLSLSLLAEGVLKAALPEARWAELISKGGYAVGFIVVILARQELYTENTIKALLPVLERPRRRSFARLARLWAVVLVANLLGVFLMSLVLGRTSLCAPEVREAFAALGRRAMEPTALEALWRGIFGGWLVAMIVWLLPYAEGARLVVIALIAYLIGAAHLTHVIAGAVDVFTLAAMGGAGWGEALGRYVLPTLAGNTIGGVVLAALLNHAQVAADDR